MCQFLQTDLHKFSLNFYKLPNVGVYFLIVVALQVLLVYMNIHSNVRGLSYLDWNCEIQRRSTLVSFQREVISKRHFENICMLLAFYVCIYFQSFVSVSVCGCSNWSVKSCNGFDCHVVCFLWDGLFAQATRSPCLLHRCDRAITFQWYAWPDPVLKVTLSGQILGFQCNHRRTSVWARFGTNMESCCFCLAASYPIRLDDSNLHF